MQSGLVGQGAWEMGDFKFSNGKVTRGILSAVISAMIFLVFPELILLLMRMITGLDPSFYTNVDSFRIVVLIASVPAIVLAFFRGHYPKGNLARLVFGEAEAVAVFLYLYLVVLSQYLSGAANAIDYGLDTNRLFLLFLYAIPIMAVACIGHFFQYRRAWLKSVGIERPVEPLPSGIGLDFTPRVGDADKAIRDTKREALTYIVVPALILLVLIPIVYAAATGPLSPSTVALLNDLSSIVDIVLVLGMILLPLAYFRGLYPKGSFSRMIFFILHSFFLVYYVYAVLVYSHLGDGISGAGLHFNYDQAVLLLMLIPLFGVIAAVGEVVDERKNWKEKLGFQVKRRPLNTASALLDFNPRTGKLGDAAKTMRRSFAYWLVVPLIALSIAAGVIRDTTQIINNVQLANEITSIATAITPFAIIIVILSFPWGLYPKGSFGRYIFGILLVPFLVLWVIAIFMDGGLQAALVSSAIIVDLGLTELLLVIYAFSFVIVPACEVADYRRAWKKKYGRSLKKLSPSESGLMTDFRIRYARFVNGAKEGRHAMISFVIIPVIVLVIAIAALQSSNNAFVQQALQSLQGLDVKVAIVGFIVAGLMFFRGMWGPGAFSRLTFGLMVTVVDVLWTLVFIGGLTNVNTQINIPGGFTIDLTPYLTIVLIIFVVLAALSGVRYLIEYLRSRHQWLAARESLVVE